MGGAQIDFDTKSEKVAQIGVQGATPVPNLISHFLKSEKNIPNCVQGGGGAIWTLSELNRVFFWEGFPEVLGSKLNDLKADHVYLYLYLYRRHIIQSSC